MTKTKCTKCEDWKDKYELEKRKSALWQSYCKDHTKVNLEQKDKLTLLFKEHVKFMENHYLK